MNWLSNVMDRGASGAWHDDELRRRMRLGPLAQRVVHTRLPALARRLSLQALREETEVATPRNSGYQREAPSEKEVRIALAALEQGEFERHAGAIP